MKSKTIQVSCAQMHWGKKLEHNLTKTVEFIKDAAKIGSQVICFPEANLTGFYFPYILKYTTQSIISALDEICSAAKTYNIWVIAGTIQKRRDKFLNLAHTISPDGRIVYEYAKIHLAGDDEKRYCKSGDKLAYFEINEILCTMAICRDGRHPEIYRIPAMAGAKILFQPSCSMDKIETVVWKRTSGRAQLPAGPTTRIFHCVANTVGQSPDGQYISSGASFIRDPSGLPIVEASPYQEELITAILDLKKADCAFAIDSLNEPTFLKPYWEQMILEMKKRTNCKPE